MKKLLFLVGLVAAPLFAATASDNLVKGLELVKSQKADWLTLERDLHNAKYNLLINEHNKMFDDKMNLVKGSTNLDEFEQKALNNLLTSHRAHMKQWHDLHMSFQTKAKSTAERQMKDFDKFEASVKPAPEKPEVEEVEVEEMELE